MNGTYACDSDHLMNTILKDHLDFKGFVMSDWWATHSTVNGVNSGLDMTMPGKFDYGINSYNFLLYTFFC